MIKKELGLTTGAKVAVVVTMEGKAFLHFKNPNPHPDLPPAKVWDEGGYQQTLVGLSLEALIAVKDLITEHLRSSDNQDKRTEGHC